MTTGLKHEPTRPARSGPADLPERMYLGAWATKADEVGYWFGEPDYTTFLHACARMTGYEKPNQRHATVAASFFRWLGTGSGEVFVAELMKLSEKSTKFNGEVGATFWLQHNSFTLKRDKGQLPLIFSILAEDKQLPGEAEVSLDDWQMLELLASWLDTTSGNMFLRKVRVSIAQQAAVVA